MSQAEARPRSNARSERTRAAILDAAETLFAERGFAETRLEDVAAAVGIRRASIVYYFADKPALYDAVLADVFDGLLARIEPMLRRRRAARRARRRRRLGLDRLHRRAARRPRASCCARSPTGAPADEPPLLRHTRAFHELIGRVLASSADDATRWLAAGRPGAPREPGRRLDRLLHRRDAGADAGLGLRSARPGSISPPTSRKSLGSCDACSASPPPEPERGDDHARERRPHAATSLRRGARRDRPVRAIQPRTGHGRRSSTPTPASR